jgi:uroporphyrinogen-III synthase
MQHSDIAARKMASLGGARVAVLETRMNRELARLVERYGGEAVSAPALREISAAEDDEIGVLLDGLSAGRFDAIVFPTGVSVTRLVERADALGRRAELIASLHRVTTVCRGPKPSAALRTIGITTSVCAREPFTTAEVLDAISPLRATHRRFALLHYGERNLTLVETLRARDATVEEIALYLWTLPEDLEPLRELIAGIIAGSVQALIITCQIQIVHLFQVATELGQADELVSALNELAVAAVGPKSRAAIEKYGVRVDVTPDNPKLGPTVAALARHIGKQMRP